MPAVISNAQYTQTDAKTGQDEYLACSVMFAKQKHSIHRHKNIEYTHLIWNLCISPDAYADAERLVHL